MPLTQKHIYWAVEWIYCRHVSGAGSSMFLAICGIWGVSPVVSCPRPCIGLYHFLLVVCSNNDAIWHRFRDITTFTVYVTGCDLEKYSIFEKNWNYKQHALFDSCVKISYIIHDAYMEVCEMEKFQTENVTFKVTKGHRDNGAIW